MCYTRQIHRVYSLHVLTVVPDLRAGGLAVDLRVVGVVELLEEVAILSERRHKFLGLGDGTAHSLGGGGEDKVGTEGLEEDATFHRHGLGHSKDELVPLGGGHHGKADAGVATGRLDKGGLAGGDVSALFGLGDHGKSDAILHGVGGVGALELGNNLGSGIGSDAVQLDEGGVANEAKDAIGDLGLLHCGREGGTGGCGGLRWCRCHRKCLLRSESRHRAHCSCC